MRWSRRLFRFLLLAYPKRIRHEGGADMWLTFERHLRDARHAGWFAVLGLWRREVMALWRGGRCARISTREQVGTKRSDFFSRMGVSSVDFKLGVRMLIKYPGLTLVGGLGIAVAVAIGAAAFTAATAMYSPLPLVDEGDRVVAIQYWNTESNGEHRRYLHDFFSWREQLESVDDLGAYVDYLQRNLVVEGSAGEPTLVAQISASAFRVAPVPAFLGRTLIEADEPRGAPPVIVIGHRIWQNRFASDPDVVGRSVRLGDEVRTVVGVMPEGFGFPIDHNLWIPFQFDATDYERSDGPNIRVFGRLAPGTTMEQARAELAALGLRAAGDFPESHARLVPRIVPYTLQFIFGPMGWLFAALFSLVVLLLAVVCVNVAVLVYARTATRRREIAVRTALGASRRRVVTQFFVEALVLSSVAAGVGLWIAVVAARQVDATIHGLDDLIPYWIDIRVSVGALFYVAALAVFGAVVVGVLPALQLTGRRMQTGIQQAAAGTMQFGRTWTTMIVLQVAFAVAALPAAVSFGRMTVAYGFADPGFAADQYLTARIYMDSEIPRSAHTDEVRGAFDLRYRESQAELIRRLDNEPGVRNVIVSVRPPGMETRARVEVEDADDAQFLVADGRMYIDFFDTFDIPILAGRRLHVGDVGVPAVIVSESFVRLLGDGDVLGRRIRFVGRARFTETPPEEPWREIVGIVGDFSNQMEPDLPEAKVYQAMVPGEVYGMSLTLRLASGAPMTFTRRLAEIAAEVDPALRLDILTLEQVMREEQGGWRIGAWSVALVTLSVLLFSAAGIYALMSFTVTQRRREIGIRAALGAEPHRLLGSIFAVATRQLSFGVAAGIGVAALLNVSTGGEFTGGEGALLLAGVAAFMIFVGLLAAVGPARRGLRIAPTEALKES